MGSRHRPTMANRRRARGQTLFLQRGCSGSFVSHSSTHSARGIARNPVSPVLTMLTGTCIYRNMGEAYLPFVIQVEVQGQ